MERALFGPAGNPQRFYDEGNKSTWQIMRWLAAMGLAAYEYSCGKGVNGSAETYRKIGAEAAQYGIRVSLHTPYFISLTNTAPESVQKTLNYVRQSVDAAHALGADRIVIHTGSVMKLDRAEALRRNRENLSVILSEISADGIRIGIETMGKCNQLGTLEEVIDLCTMDERLYPVVDFGHLNARNLGGYFVTEDDYMRVFDSIDHALGAEKAKTLHCHFSHIEYTGAGEKRHLTFADTDFGPFHEPLMAVIAKNGLTPRIICESDGTMADDALTMQRDYEKFLAQQA